MKLRIKGNSLRLRLLQSELAKFLDTGRIEETIVPGQNTSPIEWFFANALMIA